MGQQFVSILSLIQFIIA